MPQLHETQMGQRLIMHTLPDLAAQLERVANAMENKPAEKEDTTLQALIEFLEYEEATTVDTRSQQRIKNKLKELKIWN